ncbi:MAG: bifunctional ADP-heptose synthase [Chloroflexota bacterium]
MNPDHLVALIPSLAGCRVLVVGDVILDEYLIGWANRLSREAPIPVLDFERRDHIPGGAANPSMNIAALGSRAIQVGVVGDDPDAAALRTILQARGIDPSGLITDPSRPTTTKTRIMAHMGLRFPQQVARIDRLERRPVEGEIEQAILSCVQRLAQAVDVVMVSDYLTGLLTPSVVATIRKVSAECGILATADAQGQLDKYEGFDLVKCNADEAARYVGQPLITDDDFAGAGLVLVKRLGLRGGTLLTRGSEGVTLVQHDGKITHIPAVHVEDVYDTVGAGDTALAVVTLALAAGASYPDAATLANLAAGIVVRKVGNYAPSPEELLVAVKEQARRDS